jgi:hypothetical protein
VAVRSSLAPSVALLGELGVDEAAARAIDHAIAWFGAPFDAINARLREDEPLSWGAWHFSGTRLARALAALFADAPDEARALVGAFGIGVDGERLTMVTPRGVVARGSAAEDAVAANAVACAALARAGRSPAAIRAQLRTIVKEVLQPALELPAGDGQLGQVLRTPRGLALVLYSDLAWGPEGPSRLAAAAASADEPETIDRFIADLRRRRAREVSAVMRIVLSPEWDHR